MRGSAIDNDPEWSRDGRWIYYASTETGRSEIWKMSADGRTRTRLTSEGGFDPRESPDGQFVYFVANQRSYGLGVATRLQRVPVQGGAATLVYSDVVAGAWDLAGDRVVFLVPRPGANVGDEPDIVATYDIAEQHMQKLGSLPFRIAPFFANRFLTVSPDGRWVLAPTVDSWNRDILVVDNFR
jgi:dipeptidyl aminopeptidase/acylaminoacyl peptidase